MNNSAYKPLIDNEKTTLSAPGSVVLSLGRGPGIRTVIHWNRIGALFSSYRPLVAGLKVFKTTNPHAPIELKLERHRWTPNHLHLKWKGRGFTLREDKYVTKTSVNDAITIQNLTGHQLELIFLFYGGVRQWQFFDHYENELPPDVTATIDTRNKRIEIRQPHSFPGLPKVSSVQMIKVSLPIASGGFYLDEGDFFSLVENFGCLASVRLRLGQIGSRLNLKAKEPVVFKHRSPQYYFSVIVKMKPKEKKEIVVRSRYKTEGIGASFFERDLNVDTKPEKAIAEEERQWKRYFQVKVPSLSCDDKSIERFWNYVWYVLKANRSHAGAHVKHSFDSPSKHFYWGVWIWDTYFHVLGERWLRNPEIPRDSIRAVLDMQAPNGYIPCCSGVDYRMLFAGDKGVRYVLPDISSYKESADQRKASFKFTPNLESKRRETAVSQELTQTPLIACAAYDYGELQNDWIFTKEVFPRLLAYEEWMWRRRTDKAGRFIGWHGIESGWDDATRHHPVPFKPVDMTVHAYRHRRDLALMAERLGKRKLAEELWARARLTAKGVQSLWDSEKGCFLDRDGKDRKRPQVSASTFFPMWARLVSVEQADRLLSLLKRKEFATRFPVPTLATIDPDYNPHGWGWNGTVWLQVNWFIIEGLFNYGYFREAMELWEKTKSLIIKDGKPSSCELYDPELGTGIGAPDYSWQALVNDFIITRIVGLRKDPHTLTLAPLMPTGMSEIAISSLPVGGVPTDVSVQESNKQTAIKIVSAKPRELILQFWKRKSLNRVWLNGTEVKIEERGNCYSARIKIKEDNEVIAKWH